MDHTEELVPLCELFPDSDTCSSQSTALLDLLLISLILVVASLVSVYFCLCLVTRNTLRQRARPTCSNTSRSLGSQRRQVIPRDVEIDLDLEQGLSASTYKLPRTANVRYRGWCGWEWEVLGGGGFSDCFCWSLSFMTHMSYAKARQLGSWQVTSQKTQPVWLCLVCTRSTIRACLRNRKDLYRYGVLHVLVEYLWELYALKDDSVLLLHFSLNH